MLIREVLALIVIVLQPDLRELARIPRQHRREACAVAAINVRGINCGIVAGDPFAAKSRHPVRTEAPQHLRIKTVVANYLGVQRRGRVSARVEAPIQRFGLPRDERKSGVRVRRLPLPINIRAVNLRARMWPGVVRPKRAGHADNQRLLVAQVERRRKSRYEKQVTNAAQIAVARGAPIKTIRAEAVVFAGIAKAKRLVRLAVEHAERRLREKWQRRKPRELRADVDRKST